MQVYFLLDRSGSMDVLWDEALGSINGYVRNLPSDTKINLAAFDTISYDDIRNTTAGDWVPINSNEAQPRGGTPLYDSAMRMMQRAMENNDDRTVFVLMTDGYENSSTKYNKNDVTRMVTSFNNKGWEVVFLGANFDKIDSVGHDNGLTFNKIMNISTENMYSTMTTSVAATTSEYLTRGKPINYTTEMKEKATS